jgi:hypothetical protein
MCADSGEKARAAALQARVWLQTLLVCLNEPRELDVMDAAVRALTRAVGASIGELCRCSAETERSPALVPFACSGRGALRSSGMRWTIGQR